MQYHRIKIVISLTKTNNVMKKPTEQETVKKLNIFEEVAKSSLKTFLTHCNHSIFDYKISKQFKLSQLTEDQIRNLAFNFTTKLLAEELAERQKFYFDKHLTTDIS